MIQPHELMIGSWVEYDGKYYQIETIAPVFPTLNTDKFGIGVVDWNNIKPIPISEEILIKAGFKKKYFFTKEIVIKVIYYQLNDIVVYLVTNFFEVEIITPAGQYNLFKKYNYLHQLQMLYFSLTGKQLEITL